MKMKWNQFLVTTFITVAVTAIGLATAVQAAPRLYSGTLSIIGFGNDQTDGVERPYNTADNYGAYPIGVQLKCNTLPLQLAGTFTVMNHAPGSVSTTMGFTLPTYGGNAPVITKHGGSISLPPQYPIDRAAGCTQTKVQYGKPIKVAVTDFKSMATTSVDPLVRGFSIPQYDFSTQTSGGSFSNYTQYIFGITSADLKNEAGAFAKNLGPGSFTIQHLAQGGGLEGKAAVIAGPNKFGGVMRLLGFYKDREGYYRVNRISVADFTWLFDYVGATAQKSGGGVVTAGFFKQDTAMLVSTKMGAYGTSTIGITGFPWTTGAAIVTALRGPFPTSLQRTGFDLRDAGGSGAIQLVSPMLSHWDTNGFHNETGAIGVLNLVFAPEPQSWMLLGAGASLLAVLYRSNRSNRKAD